LTDINRHSKVIPTSKTINQKRTLLTPSEVAAELRLGLLTIYKYIKNDKLSAIRFGRSYRILKKDLDRFIESNKTS
jgi:excisionase family DNA binding protein